MDKKTLIAFFLIAIIMILYPWYMDIVAPVQPILPSDSTVVTRKLPIKEVTRIAPTIKTVVVAEKPKPIIEEKTITIFNDLYTAKLSTTNGGSFVSFELNEYDKYDSTLVNLIYELNRDNLLMEFISIDGDRVLLNDPWVLETSTTTIDVSRGSDRVVFSTTYNDMRITKTFTFHLGRYLIDLDIDITKIRNIISQGKYSLSWNGGLPSTEKITKDEYTFFKGLANLGGEMLEPNKLNNGNLIKEKQMGNTRWVSVQSKYFIASIIPTETALGGEVSGIKIGEHPVYNVSIIQDVKSENHYQLYLGPLDYDRIVGLGADLEKTLNLGWTPLRPVGRFIIWTLMALHKAIPNYGVVLIIFSVLLKIILSPLTKKSFQSTRRMQDLQPKIAKLKEKFKNDSSKLNQAQMALYKEEGVNPMGGCLPMLLQMPILISLFAVFRSTIEFRGEPFIWWIKDLSSPDIVFYLPFTIPIYGNYVAILPIVMGVTMFLQQKLMSPGGGAQQKFMGYFMTGFFLLLFNSFPSGLNLYYTVFNALSIVQQKYLTPAPTKKKQALPVLKTKRRK